MIMISEGLFLNVLLKKKAGFFISFVSLKVVVKKNEKIKLFIWKIFKLKN